MVYELNCAIADDIRQEIIILEKQLIELSDKLSDEIIQLNVATNCRRLFPKAKKYKTRCRFHHAVIHCYEMEYKDLFGKIDALNSLLDSLPSRGAVPHRVNTDLLIHKL